MISITIAALLVGVLLGNYYVKQYNKAITDCNQWRNSALQLQQYINNRLNK